MNFFAAHGVECKPLPTQPDVRTPDSVIELAEPVVCEVKQIQPNKEDLAALSGEPRFIGRMVPNRIRPILKDISAKLRRASEDGIPTLLAVYDATPFQLYSDDLDILQA